MSVSGVGIIDYGMGNLQSVANACDYLGYRPVILKRPQDLAGLRRVILPGVGAFAQGAGNLKSAGWFDALKKLSVEKSASLLGICLGMQLLADEGEEGAAPGGFVEGLGLIPGQVKRFQRTHVRVPHIGWNNIRVLKPNAVLTADLSDDYYFVHSYHYVWAVQDYVSATCDHGGAFAAAIHRDGIMGVQFHPEKSQGPGLKLLKNFLERGC